MGAIIAKKMDEADAARRRVGIRDLGASIIAHCDKGDYVAGLHAALSEILNNKIYEVYYEYRIKPDGPGPDPCRILSVEPVGPQVPGKPSPPIICILKDTNKKLHLHVREEDSNFKMDVVFPAAVELDGFNYLEDTAEDVLALKDTTQALNYLAAFKFLSRCK